MTTTTSMAEAVAALHMVRKGADIVDKAPNGPIKDILASTVRVSLDLAERLLTTVAERDKLAAEKGA